MRGSGLRFAQPQVTELGFEPRLSYPWKPQLQVFSAEPEGLPSEASLPGPTSMVQPG